MPLSNSSGVTYQRRDPAVSVAAILESERDDVGGQRRLVVRRLGNLELRRSMLAEHTAGEAFGHAERLLGALHANVTASGAYQFPEAASLRINFSSVRSETALRSRAFSCSKSFSRLT